MEDINFVSDVISYGALGVVTAYFMVKDWRLNSRLNETLSEFTIALNALLKKEV